jgi:hypothetical protein
MAQMTEIIIEKSTTLVYRNILGIVLESEELEYETVGGEHVGTQQTKRALSRAPQNTGSSTKRYLSV